VVTVLDPDGVPAWQKAELGGDVTGGVDALKRLLR
jgi:hypothetical protein